MPYKDNVQFLIPSLPVLRDLQALVDIGYTVFPTSIHQTGLVTQFDFGLIRKTTMKEEEFEALIGINTYVFYQTKFGGFIHGVHFRVC